MEPEALWQVTATASPIALEFDRLTLLVTGAARDASINAFRTDQLEAPDGRLPLVNTAAPVFGLVYA